MAHRLSRMMQGSPTARDRAELSRMVSEKTVAFQRAWLAMAQESMRVQYQWGTDWGAAWWAIFNKGLAPVQRRAIANARRLSR